MPEKKRMKITIRNSFFGYAGQDNIHVGNPDRVDLTLEDTDLVHPGRDNIHLSDKPEKPQIRDGGTGADGDKSTGKDIAKGVVIAVISTVVLSGAGLLWSML